MAMRDIMSDDLDDLFQGAKADVLYTDPPWGEGSLKFWRTLNGQKGHPKVCKKLGIICYANELNPDRAKKAMKILDFQLV
jgi:hypothetical protein